MFSRWGASKSQRQRRRLRSLHKLLHRMRPKIRALLAEGQLPLLSRFVFVVDAMAGAGEARRAKAWL